MRTNALKIAAILLSSTTATHTCIPATAETDRVARLAHIAGATESTEAQLNEVERDIRMLCEQSLLALEPEKCRAALKRIASSLPARDIDWVKATPEARAKYDLAQSIDDLDRMFAESERQLSSVHRTRLTAEIPGSGILLSISAPPPSTEAQARRFQPGRRDSTLPNVITVPLKADGAQVSIDDTFAGFVPTMSILRPGRHIVDVVYPKFPGFTVAYQVELRVDQGTASIVAASYKKGGCFTARSTAEADSWMAHTRNGRLPTSNGITELEIGGDLVGSDDCAYQLNFGSQKYVRLQVSSQPESALLSVENLPPHHTPTTLVLNAHVFPQSVIRLVFSKEGYVPLAYSYPAKSSFGEVHVTLTPLAKKQ